METVSLLSISDTDLSIIYNDTKINLVKKYWEHQIDTIDLTVVGMQQQNTLLCSDDQSGLSIIGYAYPRYLSKQYIHLRKEEYHDDDNDTYQPYGQIEQHTYKDGYSTNKYILQIQEPSISKYNEFIYHCHRPHETRHDMFYMRHFRGDKAIIEAGNDLAFCYTKALKEGLCLFKYHNKSSKNIAFPTLGADVGYPRHLACPIAVYAIFNFLQDYPNEYESITLFVHKTSDFKLYKKLLLQLYKPIHVLMIVCHLYINHIAFNELPKDVMRLIIKLTYNL